MILEEQKNDFPKIIHRCKKRLMYARQDWELPDKFLCPCIFTTGAVVMDDTLIMGYGAADEKVGIVKTSLSDLIAYVRTFDDKGHRIDYGKR